MSYCSHCGTYINKNYKYCRNCGFKLDDNNTEDTEGSFFDGSVRINSSYITVGPASYLVGEINSSRYKKIEKNKTEATINGALHDVEQYNQHDVE